MKQRKRGEERREKGEEREIWEEMQRGGKVQNGIISVKSRKHLVWRNQNTFFLNSHLSLEESKKEPTFFKNQ